MSNDEQASQAALETAQYILGFNDETMPCLETLAIDIQHGFDKLIPTLLAPHLARIKWLEDTLRDIANSKYCSYESVDASEYGRGSVDGHRYCAALARAALSETIPDSTPTLESQITELKEQLAKAEGRNKDAVTSIVSIIESRAQTYENKLRFENGSDETKAEQRFAVEVLEIIKKQILHQFQSETTGSEEKGDYHA